MHFDAPHGNLVGSTILIPVSSSPLHSKCYSQISYGMHTYSQCSENIGWDLCVQIQSFVLGQCEIWFGIHPKACTIVRTVQMWIRLICIIF
jgi:hypothetical protein